MKKIMLLLPLALVLLIGLVSAATLTMKYPIASTTFPAGVVTLNTTWDASDPTGMGNITNVTYYASASNNNQTSAVVVCYNASMGNYNGTSGATNQSLCNFNTALIQDSLVWVFYATAKNASNGSQTAFESATVSSVTVDNTVPNTPVFVTADKSVIERDDAISATVTDANTTSCTLTVGLNSYTMTYSTTSCTYTLLTASQNLDFPAGVYSAYVTASDGLNTTSSNTFQFDFQPKSGWRKTVGPTAEEVVVSTIEQQPGVLGGLFQNKLVLLVLLFLIIVWWNGQKK